MYKKNYRDYLNTLRTREPRPRFEQIATLVTSSSSAGSAIPFIMKFIGAVVLSGLIATGSWLLFAKFLADGSPATSTPMNAPSSIVARPIITYLPPRATRTVFSHAERVRYATIESKSSDTRRNRLNPLPETQSYEPPMLLPCVLPKQASISQPATIEPRPIPSIAIQNSDNDAERNFFLTLADAMSQQFSSNTLYRQSSFSDPSIGIGYKLADNSSVLIMVGAETFISPSKTTTNTIFFHDTTFVRNGQQYQNVIGEIQSTNLPTPSRVFWLGASYRYTLGNASNKINPFAEIMAGGSTEGPIARESLGAEFPFPENFSFDLDANASELMPQNNILLTKVGFAAAISYAF